jgi:hypothetical protein
VLFFKLKKKLKVKKIMNKAKNKHFCSLLFGIKIFIIGEKPVLNLMNKDFNLVRIIFRINLIYCFIISKDI